MPNADYFTTVTAGEMGVNHRSWTGNDEKGRKTHHGIVRVSESPLDVVLHWTANSNEEPQLVGCYRLNLPNLLRGGYIRQENRAPGQVRLRFVHDGDSIYLRIRHDGPNLRIGNLKATSHVECAPR